MNIKKLQQIKEKCKINRFNVNGSIENDNEILVHCNTGNPNHEYDLINNLQHLLNKYELKVRLVKSGPFAMFNLGKIITTYPSGVIYTHVENANLEELIISHFVNKKIYNNQLHKLDNGTICKTKNDFPFFKNQKIIVTKNIGVIDAESIEEYIATGGYLAAYKSVNNLSSEQIIDTIKTSGLRGRGGAGFYTHLKWQFAKSQTEKIKYVVCNADEGDPGAFMNRAVLEGNPHSVIEGMIIAAKAINAKKGFIYIRSEYPLATKIIKLAINNAKKLGLLGNNLFDTNFCFDIEVKVGAGAYVCGEETALINSLEGFRGEPKPKPPFPTTSGVYGKPSVINNVETLSVVPLIITNGGNWYSQMGSEKSKGTKTFALSGDIVNAGLIELELGEKLSTIIYDIGGGIPNNKKLKLVQLGGPSGGCLTKDMLDTKVDYEDLIQHGAIMGSGSMIVANSSTCVVDLSKFFLEFTCEESCGKCTPCRIGNKRVLELLTKITKFKATMDDFEHLKYLCNHIKSTSLCGLGQASTNPVLSSISNFEKEYINHIQNRRCIAGTCTKKLKYEITNKCIACALCFKACPSKAIIPDGNKYKIIQEKCIKCGKCYNVCPNEAIIY